MKFRANTDLFSNSFERDKVYEAIMALISTGSENAISMREIATVLNITPRIVRRWIMLARQAGKIIVGDDNGYYYPADDDELRGYVLRTRARLISSYKAYLPASRALSDITDDAQIMLNDLLRDDTGDADPPISERPSPEIKPEYDADGVRLGTPYYDYLFDEGAEE